MRDTKYVKPVLDCCLPSRGDRRSPPPTAAAAIAMEPGEASTLTTTQREQLLVEKKVADIFSFLTSVPPQTQSLMLEVWRDKHVEYLTTGLRTLGPNFHVLDANRPWICYWILHPLALLDEWLEPEQEVDVVDFLGRCQDPLGGYGGGPGQLPHLATTYAAVNSLITIGGERALSSINRDTLHSYLRRMKQPSGAFRMHDAGEMDVRACYTAISVASVLNILDSELVENVGDYILSCQTYEGGIAGEPGSEAHGGYTFCGLAAMILINEAHRLDLPALIDWVTFRQGIECGFQGRTNKLVDGCYSFWQGGVLALIQRLSSVVNDQIKILFAGGKLNSDSSSPSSLKDRLSDIGLSFLEDQSKSSPLFHSIALQQYVLLCSQILEGGFRDKPGKSRDFYHTCYCLSGLSLCQYSWIKEKANAQPPLPSAVLGTYDNLLEPTHPLFNVVLDKFYEARNFFSSAT